MEVLGKVKLITDTQSVGSSGFTKRDIVVTTEEQYPQHISVQFVKDKCDMLDAYAIGDEVKIGINLRGREWVSPQGEIKYFNTIQGWRIEKGQGTPLADPSAVNNYNASNLPPVSGQEEDDLPF